MNELHSTSNKYPTLHRVRLANIANIRNVILLVGHVWRATLLGPPPPPTHTAEESRLQK